VEGDPKGAKARGPRSALHLLTVIKKAKKKRVLREGKDADSSHKTPEERKRATVEESEKALHL